MSEPLSSNASPLALLRQERRSVAVAYLLWALAFFGAPFGLPGLNGLHRFYCRKPLSGGVWLFSFGLLGIGQLVDLFLIPSLVDQANQPLALQAAIAAGQEQAFPSLEVQLLGLARRSGDAGFTLNDALLELQRPASVDSQAVRAEIERLLYDHLLEVGNDSRGRVVYREP